MVIHIPSRPIGKALRFEGVSLMRVGESLREKDDLEYFTILQEQDRDFSARICKGLAVEDLSADAIINMRILIHQKRNKPEILTTPLSQRLYDLEKLSDTEMERIIALELEEGSLIWHCKNYFMFSYYCAGIRAADLIQLRWRNDTENGRLHYQMGKNHKDRDLLLVDQALDILRYYHNDDVKQDDYIFPLLDNDAPFAKFVTQADKDRMKPVLRHQLYQQISAKNALINKYLKKIAEKAGITTNLTMHISRHAFTHIAQEAGAESSAIKNSLGHSNLATTERYMGSFDTSKTDNTLRNLFKKKAAPKHSRQEEADVAMTKEEQAIELLKGMTPEQIMAVISAINK